MATTKKTNVIIPQIMGPAINARLDKALRLMPYAKIDDTLEGTEGDTVKIPVWDYAGDAVEVAEGEEVETSALSCDVREYTVKKAMKAFPITDEAQLSTRGLGEQAERQLVLSIKGKIEQDLNDACYESASVKTVEHDGQIDYTAIVRGASAFGLETNPAKVILIHPNQEAAILNSDYFKNLSKFGKHVGIDGVIGQVAGCWVKKSKRVKYVEATTQHGAYYLNPIVVIDNEESVEEDPTPALTIFVKREFALEVSRDSLSQTLALVGSKHYLAALTDSAKVVLLKNIVSDALPCTLTYDANGGTGSMDPQTGQAGTDLTVADNEFTREGYSFAKWNTKADGSGTDYDPDDTLTIEEDTTLYAQWVINRTLTYDANGGEGSMNPEVVEDGGTLTVAGNTFTKAGYNFTEWNTAADGSGDSYDPEDDITLDADVTLYAQWAIADYTITFDANNGRGTMAPQTIPAGESAALNANTYTRMSHQFTGWNTAADGSGTHYDDRETITPAGDMTLYAQWARIRVFVYSANNGSGTTKSYSVPTGSTVTVEACSFTKSGYTFKDWNTESDGSGTTYDPGDPLVINDDLTLYAQWEDNPFVGSFATNPRTLYAADEQLPWTGLTRNYVLIFSAKKMQHASYIHVHSEPDLRAYAEAAIPGYDSTWTVEQIAANITGLDKADAQAELDEFGIETLYSYSEPVPYTRNNNYATFAWCGENKAGTLSNNEVYVSGWGTYTREAQARDFEYNNIMPE